MTTAATLLTDLAARGVTLEAAGNRLRFHPRSAVTAELVARLREHKAELLAMLTGGNGDPPDPRHGAMVAGGPAHGSTAAPVADPQDLTESDAAEWLERISPDGRRIWQRPEMAALEVFDFPAPCAVCGGIDQWQDLVDGWHCERCEPRTAGPRLRELVQRLRVRYEMTS